MKYFLFVLFILIAGKASCQEQSKIRSEIQFRNDTIKKYQDSHAPVIAAKDAYKYVGRRVIVKDSLYSGTNINDSTFACQMGEQTSTPRLTLLYTSNNKDANQRFFNTFRRFRVTIWGIISGTKDAPILILHGFSSTNFSFDAKQHGNVQKKIN